jgi:hypothetical protein
MTRLSDDEMEERLSGLRSRDLVERGVTVRVTTHSEGGLTANDFELARRIDAVA